MIRPNVSIPQPLPSTPSIPHALAAESVLPLMLELEASLYRSRQQILAGDVESLEGSVAEQAELQKKLAKMLEPAGGLHGEFREAETELGQAATRIVQLARVQLALLARRRQHLVIIANVLAGIHQGYALQGSHAASQPVADGGGARGEILCRV